MDAGADQCVPRLDTLTRLLGALQYKLSVVDRHGRPLTVDDAHEGLRDRADRHFPAHFDWEPMRSAADGSTWWAGTGSPGG